MVPPDEPNGETNCPGGCDIDNAPTDGLVLLLKQRFSLINDLLALRGF